MTFGCDQQAVGEKNNQSPCTLYPPLFLSLHPSLSLSLSPSSLPPTPNSLIHSLIRLEVSVNDSIAVDVLECQHSLCKVVPCHLQRQTADVLEQSGQVSSLNVLHHHVQVFLHGLNSVLVSVVYRQEKSDYYTDIQ